jgi:serine/threonine protein kinase
MRVCPTCYAQEQESARYCGLCGTPLLEIKSSADQMVGQIIGGKFSIERLIGRGGMGDVYLACDRILDRKVAIKILNHRFRGDETVIIRFHKEAKSYARVNHANAVVLFDYGQLDDGNVYLVMEYVDGCNLTDYMRRIGGPMPQDIAHALASQLSEALIAAHAQGVVHRDLKPDNIMLTEPTKGRLQVKILDFGIAKLLDDQSDNQLTQAGMVFGTPEFMSPEQAQGIEVDHRTDIYAFGMIVYYMLTHRLPFEGKNKIAILNQQVNDAPDPPSVLCPEADIHPAFEQLVMGCLEKDRGDRYPSFEAVLHDLDRLRTGEPLTMGADLDPPTEDGLAAEPPEFIDLDAPPQRPNALPSPRQRPEMSGLISIGQATPGQHMSRSQRAEVSGVFSLGNAAPSHRGARSDASGVFSLGSVTPAPHGRGDSAPASGDLSLRLDTHSPSWFDEGEEVELDPSAVMPARPKAPPSARSHAADGPQAFNTDLSHAPSSSARGEPTLTIGGPDEEDDGFTLDGPLHSHTYKRRRDSGGVGLILFLLLLGGGGAAAYWFWIRPASNDATVAPTDTADAAAVSASSDALDSPQQGDALDSPPPGDALDPTPSPSDPTRATDPGLTSTQAGAPSPPVKPPPPLAMALNASTRQRAIARAVLTQSTVLFDEMKFKEADRFLSEEHLNLPSITGPLLDSIATLRATNQRAQALLSSALGHAQTLQCHLAENEIIELASISPPAAKSLEGKLKSCKKKLEAPPSRIPD